MKYYRLSHASVIRTTARCREFATILGLLVSLACGPLRAETIAVTNRVPAVPSDPQGLLQPARLFRGFKPPTDTEIQRTLERRLARDAALAGDVIRMSVRDHVVSFSGTVGSWTQRGAAERDAYNAGASGVIDELKVEYGK
jgi:BON domain